MKAERRLAYASVWLFSVIESGFGWLRLWSEEWACAAEKRSES